MSNRITQLLIFLDEEPKDTFTLYALALEYMKLGKVESELYFNILLNEHENYVPTYFHAAQYFIDKGDREKAEEIFKKGITIAEKVNDNHALLELKNAYTNFQMEQFE